MDIGRNSVAVTAIVSLLIVACSQTEQIATSVPITRTESTYTLQPTHVLIPSPTATRGAYSLGDNIIRPADEMIMVYVPSGTFQMGSSQEDIDAALALCDQYPNAWKECERDWFELEYPQHSVSIDNYWIDSTEVTNSQYNRCVEAGNCQPSRLANQPAYNGVDYPVAGVPWQDTVDYCAWAGGRLPTEQEWEYAARGSQSNIFPWGDDFRCDGGNLYDPNTGCEDGFTQPAPVGSYLSGKSWCGAYDMTGNVWEWVADEFCDYPSNATTEVVQPISTNSHILRGGSWGYPPAFSRSAYRYPVPPETDYLAVGFRCTVSLDE